MANNRMWLRCDHCNDEYRLAKYYPKLTDGWFTAPRIFNDLYVFLEKHSFCPTGARTMVGNTAFSLRFEETA